MNTYTPLNYSTLALVQYKRSLLLIYILTKHNKKILFLDPLETYKQVVLRYIEDRDDYKFNFHPNRLLFEGYANSYFKLTKVLLRTKVKKKFIRFLKKKKKEPMLADFIPKNWYFTYPEFSGLFINDEHVSNYPIRVLMKKIEKLKKQFIIFSTDFKTLIGNFSLKADLYVMLTFKIQNSYSLNLFYEIERLGKPIILNLTHTFRFYSTVFADNIYYTQANNLVWQNFFFFSIFRLLEFNKKYS